ncbi:MAG: hypothetical protein H0S80_15365 [Desulfovibrionaceae bacterium]|nr:hypothetical protein [Desulfovibrionaceae bacterium]
MAIVAVTTRPSAIRDFLVELADASREEVEVETSGADALTRVKGEPPRLVVIDQGLPDVEPLKLVVEIMMVSAMTLTAVITDMGEDEFHEAAEGYGVLMPLPADPQPADGRALAEALRNT